MDAHDIQSGLTKEYFWFKAKNELIRILMVLSKSKNPTIEIYNTIKPERLKILNVGVGTGDDLKILQSFGDNYIIDTNIEVLKNINTDYLEKKQADVCSLPYADNFFDIIVASDVLEHVENDQQAMAEIYRVLKKDGTLIFTVPAFQFLYSQHDKTLQHKRRYNSYQLKKLLLKFSKTKIFYWNSLLFIPLVFFRLLTKKLKISGHGMLPSFLNKILYKLLSIDNLLIKHNFSLPVGLSIVGYGKK